MRAELAFRLFRLRLDRRAAGRDVTAVVLTCDPNPNLEACLASLQAQTVRPAAIEVVRNITPVSLAEQQGLDRVNTRYYISVDGDMILDADYVERLYHVLESDPRCGQATFHVTDPILGRIMAGGRMYRTEPVREIGYHPFHGARDHDRYMSRELKARGYRTPLLARAAGLHHPVYLPHEAYWKFKVNAEKARYYGDRWPTFRELTDRIVDYWRRTHDDVALYALAGLFAGLASPDVRQELTYEGRADDAVFLRIREFLEATAKAARQAPDGSRQPE